jgi:hypothetical protein
VGDGVIAGVFNSATGRGPPQQEYPHQKQQQQEEEEEERREGKQFRRAVLSSVVHQDSQVTTHVYQRCQLYMRTGFDVKHHCLFGSVIERRFLDFCNNGTLCCSAFVQYPHLIFLYLLLIYIYFFKGMFGILSVWWRVVGSSKDFQTLAERLRIAHLPEKAPSSTTTSTALVPLPSPMPPPPPPSHHHDGSTTTHTENSPSSTSSGVYSGRHEILVDGLGYSPTDARSLLRVSCLAFRWGHTLIHAFFAI